MRDEPFSPYLPRKYAPPSPVDPSPVNPSPVDPPPGGESEGSAAPCAAPPDPAFAREQAIDDETVSAEAPPPCQSPPAFDEQSIWQATRAEAMRLATIACARALGEAARSNADVIARFVDDAVTASGAAAIARVRLHPDDAGMLPPQPYALHPDGDLQRGDVYVENTDGILGASIDARADLLVKAAELA